SIPYLRLRPGVFDPEIAELIDPAITQRLKVLPLFRIRGDLFLAMANPQAIPNIEEIEDRTELRVRPVLARAQDILGLAGKQSGLEEYATELSTEVGDDFEVIDGSLPDDYSAIDEFAGASPVINLVNSIIQRAVRDGASDIHIEPFRNYAYIRFRIDGLLYEHSTPRIELHPAIISRLKVMSNLDIAERRLPQDGRVQVMTQGRAVDLRFSSLPGLYGEKVVLRVLDKNQAILDVDKLGMAEGNVATFKQLLKRQHGLILVTGPTGSGKTTSLYAALNYLKSVEKNIVTIEDPVEYQLDIINQNEVRAQIDLTFAKMLKHVLRQDPDVIMVGEIRERETAEIAVQAALTGHLVLSTLHTNDSQGAITRMIDMGVEPYLLSSAIIGVVAQRLVRRICSSCMTTSLALPEVSEQYGWEDQNVHLARGRGCVECYDSGYKGRLGIHEILESDEDLRRLIVSHPDRDQLSEYIQRKGIKTMFSDGLHRVREHQTTIEELARVTTLG
ncbi:MAG: type II/IV secretion system protein, partial [Gammaproteobacteria bacterium]|nr:type II/IV secretion system protein [Gammaproteobacteria bacterium]